MKKINLREADLSVLNPLIPSCMHVESYLYTNKDLLYKIFTLWDYNMDEEATDEIFENCEQYIERKKQKLTYLLQRGSILNIANPTALIYIDNVFAGYSMKYYRNYAPISNLLKKTIEQQIKILRQASIILKRLHEKEKIIINDLNMNNILYHGNDCLYCDIDSSMINGVHCDTTYYIIGNNNKIKHKYDIRKEFDVYSLTLFMIHLIYRIDIEELIMLSIKEYHAFINSLPIPIDVKKILFNLYKMVNMDEKSVYPHEYIDSFTKRKYRQ